jgi:hypothetical protein
VIENQEINGERLCPRCGRISEYLAESLIPDLFTCGPGLCSIVGLPDAYPLRFFPRSSWKDWRDYR